MLSLRALFLCMCITVASCTLAAQGTVVDSFRRWFNSMRPPSFPARRFRPITHPTGHPALQPTRAACPQSVALRGIRRTSHGLPRDGIGWTGQPKARKALIETKEALKSQFEGELRRLTVREGVILIRLIDRQANQTTYAVVRELKGRLSAFMWQGLARLFGHDLKSQYDPTGDDAAIEHILHAHGLASSSAPDKPSLGALD